MSDRELQNGPAARPPHAFLHGAGVAVLLLGLFAAALIYVLAADDPGTDPADVISGGRMYRHNLELMGGKFAVLAEAFNHWFAGLWHGRNLAYTIAVLAVAIALVCFWAARLKSAPVRSAERKS